MMIVHNIRAKSKQYNEAKDSRLRDGIARTAGGPVAGKKEVLTLLPWIIHSRGYYLRQERLVVWAKVIPGS